MEIKRFPLLDRPALTYPFAEKEAEIFQQVGFLDEQGSPFELSLERAIELGLVAQGQIKIASMPLEKFAKMVHGKKRK